MSTPLVSATAFRGHRSRLEASWHALLVAEGDARLEAWGRFYAEAQARLAVAVHYLMPPLPRRRYAVEDILSEAFCVALARLDEFQTTENDGAYRWVLNIARKVLCAKKRYELVRRGERGSSDLSSDWDDSSRIDGQLAAASAFRVSRIVVRREEIGLTIAMLDALPDGERELIRLRVFEAYSYDDISARLGVATVVLRKRFERAIRKARDLVDTVPEIATIEIAGHESTTSEI